MPHDFGLLWGFGEEAKADLPSGGIGAQLVDVVESLCFESLVGGRVPGDLNSIRYLKECMCQFFMLIWLPLVEGLTWGSGGGVVVFFLGDPLGLEGASMGHQTNLFSHLRPAKLPFRRGKGSDTERVDVCWGSKLFSVEEHFHGKVIRFPCLAPPSLTAN